MLENEQRIVESIIVALAREIASDGFEFDLTSSCFVRQDGDFRHVFQVAFMEKHGRLVCTPNVGIRSDRIEGIFHRTSEFSEFDAVNTSTLGVNVKLLSRSSDYDLSIATAGDVNQGIQILLRAFRDIAVPYFKEFSSLEDIDHALNSNPSERCIHMINERARCSKGLIAAKLLERTDYEQLREIYDSKVLKAGEMTYRKYFLPLVDDLEHLGVL